VPKFSGTKDRGNGLNAGKQDDQERTPEVVGDKLASFYRHPPPRSLDYSRALSVVKTAEMAASPNRTPTFFLTLTESAGMSGWKSAVPGIQRFREDVGS
jgi:hypothetical protein